MERERIKIRIGPEDYPQVKLTQDYELVIRTDGNPAYEIVMGEELLDRLIVAASENPWRGATGMAKNLSTGSKVRYAGELPEGWDRTGRVVAIEPDIYGTGDPLATVEFGGPGLERDIPVSELERDPMDAQHYDDDGNPFE